MILSKKSFFSKHQNKVILVLKLLNSRTKTTLKSSVVIFQALETSPASLTSVASVSSLASTASKVQFPQKTSWSWWSDHHWHQNNHCLSFFCGMDHQKSNFSLIYGTLSDGGRWGHMKSKKVSNGGSGINFHYSGSHWASLFGRFVKISVQPRSLLYINS